jgi:hypothetical protein
MINILIYDVAGAHHDSVKFTTESYLDCEATFFRRFDGFSENNPPALIEFIQENNIKVVIVPYNGVFHNFLNSGGTDFIAVMTATVQSFTSGFRPNLRVRALDPVPPQQSQQPIAREDIATIAEIYPESDSRRTEGSQAVGKIGAFVANLLALGYDIPTARQIIRQNGSTFPLYNYPFGFGFVGESISIPDVIYPLQLDEFNTLKIDDKLYINVTLDSFGWDFDADKLFNTVEKKYSDENFQSLNNLFEFDRPQSSIKGFRNSAVIDIDTTKVLTIRLIKDFIGGDGNPPETKIFTNYIASQPNPKPIPTGLL